VWFTGGAASKLFPGRVARCAECRGQRGGASSGYGRKCLAACGNMPALGSLQRDTLLSIPPRRSRPIDQPLLRSLTTLEPGEKGNGPSTRSVMVGCMGVTNPKGDRKKKNYHGGGCFWTKANTKKGISTGDALQRRLVAPALRKREGKQKEPGAEKLSEGNSLELTYRMRRGIKSYVQRALKRNGIQSRKDSPVKGHKGESRPDGKERRGQASRSPVGEAGRARDTKLGSRGACTIPGPSHLTKEVQKKGLEINRARLDG